MAGRHLTRDAALAAALLAAALGFALAHQTWRQVVFAWLIAMTVALAVSALVLPLNLQEPAIVGSTVITLAAVATVYADRTLHPWLVGFGAAAGGGLIGALTSFRGQPRILVIAGICLLSVVPALWLARTRRSLGNKVLASWILAVSMLSLGLALSQGVMVGADHLD